MKMKQLRECVVLFVFLISGLCSAVSVYANPVEGQDYKVLVNPQPTQNKALIEVIEFFGMVALIAIISICRLRAG